MGRYNKISSAYRTSLLPGERFTWEMRQAKQKHFQNLNPSDAKQFWKTIKVLNKQNVHGGSLTHNGLPCPSDTEKANSLNDFFSMCFNTSCQPISTIMTSAIDGHECPPELLCTEEEVCSLLKSIDTSKASGPDGVSARMLKSTADVIAPSVTKLFNFSIRCCRPPRQAIMF